MKENEKIACAVERAKRVYRSAEVFNPMTLQRTSLTIAAQMHDLALRTIGLSPDEVCKDDRLLQESLTNSMAALGMLVMEGVCNGNVNVQWVTRDAKSQD